MINTIFFGNGINRMAGGESWDDVLSELTSSHYQQHIKLKYEYIILPKKDKIKVPIMNY